MRKTDNHVERDSSHAFTLNVSNDCCSKGDVTRDDSQRRFLAQPSVASLLRHCFMVATLFQHCNAVLR